MMKRKYESNILISLMFIFLLIFMGCNNNVQYSKIEEKETIKVGVLIPLSGPFAKYGEKVKAGIDAGASGSVYNVELVYEDTACDVKKTLSAYNKLKSIDDVEFIIGPACGSPQEALAPVVSEKDSQTILMLPSSASEELYLRSYGNIFQGQYSIEQESKEIAFKTSEMGFENVVVVSYDNQFSQTHAITFSENFEGNILEEFRLDPTNTDIKSELLKIKELNPDAIIVTDATFFFIGGVGKLKEYGIESQVVSNYITGLKDIRSLTSEVIFSYPDFSGGEEAHYEIARESTRILVGAIGECSSEFACVKRNLGASGVFDENNVKKQDIVFRQIVGEGVVGLD